MNEEQDPTQVVEHIPEVKAPMSPEEEYVRAFCEEFNTEIGSLNKRLNEKWAAVPYYVQVPGAAQLEWLVAMSFETSLDHPRSFVYRVRSDMDKGIQFWNLKAMLRQLHRQRALAHSEGAKEAKQDVVDIFSDLVHHRIF